MTAEQLYFELDKRIPRALSCEWDNDGFMCSPDKNREVRHILLALDVTKDTVEYAEKIGADLIISHHPMIFKGIKSVNEDDFTSAKVIKLIKNGISVFSFHTRLDALEGGVNDALAEALGVFDTVKFGEDGEMLGRLGEVDECDLDAFAVHVKNALGSDHLNVTDAGRTVKKVALLGGDGKDFLKAASSAGADTYVTGTMSYNSMLDAYDMGINVIEAGHYFTEAPVLGKLEEMIKGITDGIKYSYYNSNAVKLY